MTTDQQQLETKLIAAVAFALGMVADSTNKPREVISMHLKWPEELVTLEQLRTYIDNYIEGYDLRKELK